MARQGNIELTPAEKSSLKELINKGRHRSQELKRALILLLVAEGKPKRDVAQLVGISYSTVFNVLNAYRRGGLSEALYDAPRSGRVAELSPEQRAHITAIACSAAPSGHSRWTLRLLADRLVELGVVEHISHEHVRRVLKKTL